ncbi:MAG: glycosyltransferase [Verrucomicrobia bacterium]|nr:MAG: glycosyltransferase [Verrucomicrobiota bacterium]
MDQNSVISIVIPLQQDGNIVDSVVRGIDRVIGESFRFYEIILVDDGSTDETRSVVTELLKSIQRIRYQRLSRSFGRDICISAGIESAIGDYVCTLNPRTDPAAVIPSMIQQCKQLGGIVHGLAENPRDRGIIRGIAGWAFRKYCQNHLGVDIKRGVSDFRVMSRQAVNALLQIREQSRHLRVLTLMLGYHHAFFRYQMENREENRRNQDAKGEIATAIELLTSNTRHPLRMITCIGMFGAFLNLLYAIYVVCVFFTKPDVATGWTTTSLQLSGMFFLICAILTVMSEYLGTILREVRGRPLYFMAEESTSSVLLEDTVRSSLVKESVSDTLSAKSVS